MTLVIGDQTLAHRQKMRLHYSGATLGDSGPASLRSSKDWQGWIHATRNASVTEETPEITCFRVPLPLATIALIDQTPQTEVIPFLLAG